jgi:valyl-tRNA synthetase
VPLAGAIAALPVADVIDLAVERARLARALAEAEADISKVRARLDNPAFRAKASAEAIEEQDERLAEATALRAQLASALERIG